MCCISCIDLSRRRAGWLGLPRAGRLRVGAGGGGSGDRRRPAFLETQPFHPAWALEPDFLAFNPRDFVTLDLIPFAINCVVDHGQAAAGLVPDGLEFPMQQWRIGLRVSFLLPVLLAPH